MKKTVEMAAAGKTWELCFTIRSLAAFERKLGASVISLFAGGGLFCRPLANGCCRFLVDRRRSMASPAQSGS